LEKIIKTLTGGYTCRYTDEGVTCIQDSGTKNTEIYFPYGSITKIKLGFLGLDIISADQSFYMPVSGKTKAEVKEMVEFIQNKMKNAKPEKATAVSATGRQSLSGNQHVTERKFYDACQKMNLALSESSPPADIQHAVLIAGQNNLKLSEKDVIIAYAIGKKEARHARRQHRFKELYDSGKELEKYLSYHGKEKEVMLTGKMLNYYKQQEEYICSGRAIPLQKEKDWAIMGGIASAIAGGVAGIAVASDIQRKNAEIRAQNAAVSASYAKAVIPALNKVREEISK